MKKILLLGIIAGILSSGCAIFMPYKEDFICKVPEGKGYCGSLSDGYIYSINLEK